MSIRMIRKCFLAISAGIRFFPGMGPHVQIEPSLYPECLRTVLALKRHRVHVDKLVFLQRPLPLKTGSTYGTYVGLVGRMSYHMRFEVGSAGEAFFTFLTLERTDVPVHPLVGGQCSCTVKALTAKGALSS